MGICHNNHVAAHMEDVKSELFAMEVRLRQELSVNIRKELWGYVRRGGDGKDCCRG